MNARSYFATDAQTVVHPLEELTRVALLRAFDTEAGVLPKGARGTIVSSYDRGAAYYLEFTRPFPALLTVASGDVAPIHEGQDGPRPAAADELPDRA